MYITYTMTLLLEVQYTNTGLVIVAQRFTHVNFFLAFF